MLVFDCFVGVKVFMVYAWNVCNGVRLCLQCVMDLVWMSLLGFVGFYVVAGAWLLLQHFIVLSVGFVGC